MAPWILSPLIECAPSQTSDFLRCIRAHLPSLGENNLDCVQRQNTSLGRCRYGKKQTVGQGCNHCLSRRKERGLVGAGTTARQRDNDFSSMDVWRVYAKARAQCQAYRRGFSGPKERIRRRTDLAEREKLQVARERRLSSPSSSEGGFLQRAQSFDKPAITWASAHSRAF